MAKAPPAALLRQMEALREDFGDGAAARKLKILRGLNRGRLRTADQVLRLHNCLLFLRSCPDNREVLLQVERMLGSFEDRSDLKALSGRLADTGIAGTVTRFRFYWFTALWLAERCPDRLTIDWTEFANQARIPDILHLLVPYSETPVIDTYDFEPREWFHLLKGPDETDAAFLVRRFAALRADSFGRETAYELLDVPMRLEPGPETPTRTLARYDRVPVHFQTRPLHTGRPDLERAVHAPPLSVREVPPQEGRRLVDMAREAMIPRLRDLDVFVHADPDNVRLIDCGEGLQFACLGAVPERRLLFEAVYGFLTLRSGVPTGYVLTSALFNSCEVAYNVFDTWRGGDAGWVYGRILAMSRHLFNADTFAVDPYQLGHNNTEGLESGAWWFYYKLGFRPDDPGVKRLVERELRRMKKNRKHRSSLATLQELTSAYMFLDTRRPRQDVMGRVDLGNVGLRISGYLARRFGSDREGGVRRCSAESARLLGQGDPLGFTAGERLAWDRWAPLVCILPGLARWTAEEKRDLVRVIRAKGGRHESDFVRRFDAHSRLRKALTTLADAD